MEKVTYTLRSKCPWVTDLVIGQACSSTCGTSKV